MSISQFINKANVVQLTELDKVKFLAYYYMASQKQNEFVLDDIEGWFVKDLNHGKPNLYRLRANILKSKDFVKGNQVDSFKLNVKVFSKLEEEYKLGTNNSEEIDTWNSILPQSLYENSRQFIISLAKQINASYENNISDGCAVLMRRLLEISLILAYQNLGIEIEIQNPDKSYKMLDGIINNAVTNGKLALSKDSKTVLQDFKELGNFSAHKIYYNCRKSEIDIVSRKYRATIEELFYKSGLLK